MKRIILLAALLPVVLISCGKDRLPDRGKQPEEKKYERTPLKIMSFNVAVDNRQENKGWTWRKAAVNNMITAEKPLVIGFQEAQAHEIAGMIKAHPEYGWYGIGRDTGVAPRDDSENYSAEETMAVFWLKDSLTIVDRGTFWLSETPDQVSYGWDAAYRRTMTWVKFSHKRTGAKFFIFNTHLDNKGKTARTESMALIIKKMSELNPGWLPTFLMADFNTQSTNAIFDDLNKIMSSARDKAISSEREKMTFNNYTTVGKSQIDHIFFSGDMLVTSFRVLDGDYGNIYISDHYPIVAEFSLKNK